MDEKTEILVSIKCRIRLSIDAKQIFDELCDIFGLLFISVRTVFRRVKDFKASQLSVKDDTRLGRPKTFITKTNIIAVITAIVE